MSKGVSPKLLVVLVAVLVALSVAAGVMGAVRTPSASLESPPSWLKSLGGLIATPRPVQTQDIGRVSPGECGQLLAGIPLTLTQSLSCELDIQAASDRVRTLSLQSLSGDVKVVYVPSDPDQPPLEPELGADEDAVTLQVPKDGGTLTLACGSLLCVITVGE
jgi:hypothetical protein